MLPGICISLLPKLTCPMCWPAYTGFVSALGLGFLISTKNLLLLTLAFLAITAATLGFGASRRHGYYPLWLGLFAGVVILIGKFYFDSAQMAYLGVGLLIAVSVWNRWPRRAVVSNGCPACGSTEAAFNEQNTHGNRHMKHKIEVFSAGCKLCKGTIDVIRKLAGPEHEVVVLDMHQDYIANRAAQYGVRSLPAVVIDRKLVSCCSRGGVEESVLREALR